MFSKYFQLKACCQQNDQSINVCMASLSFLLVYPSKNIYIEICRLQNISQFVEIEIIHMLVLQP